MTTLTGDAGTLREILAELYYRNGVYGRDAADIVVRQSVRDHMLRLGRAIAGRTGAGLAEIFGQAIEDAGEIAAAASTDSQRPILQFPNFPAIRGVGEVITAVEVDDAAQMAADAVEIVDEVLELLEQARQKLQGLALVPGLEEYERRTIMPELEGAERGWMGGGFLIDNVRGLRSRFDGTREENGR